MSGKFKKMQRHQRWNEAGTCWSSKYLAEVSSLAGDSPSGPLPSAPLRLLASELLTLSRQQHTWGEVEELRRVLNAFQKLAGTASSSTVPSPSPGAPPAAAATAVSEPITEAPANKVAGESAATAVAALADSSAAGGGCGPHSGPLAVGCWLLSGLLFQPGSRPLHRALLGAVKRLSPGQLDVFGAAVTRRLREALTDLDAAAPLTSVYDTGSGGSGSSAAPPPPPSSSVPSSVPLADVMSSLLWLSAAYDWVRPVAAAAIARLAAGVDVVLAAADRGALHIAPGLMEEVLDAVGALYYLLQHLGGNLVVQQGDRQGCVAGAEDPRAAVVLAGRAMLRALQGRALVREALASAAVVLWAAVLLPDLPPGAAAAAFGQGLFFPAPNTAAAGSGRVIVYDNSDSDPTAVNWPAGCGGAEGPLAGSWVDSWLRSGGSSLVSEIRRFSPIGRICSLKGLVTAMPKEATCARLCLASPPPPSSSSSTSPPPPPPQPWHFLIDGALSYGCSSIRDAPDAHFKFHASCVLSFCVSKLLESWQQQQQQQLQSGGEGECGGGGGDNSSNRHNQSSAAPAPASTPTTHMGAEGEAAEAARGGGQTPPPPPEDGGSGGDATGRCSGALRPPLLQPEVLDMLMELMRANLDEPLAQSARQLQDAFQLLLEVLAYQDRLAPGLLPPLATFKQQVVSQLLAVPYNRKGRYPSLALLAERGCALSMLKGHPGLVGEALAAMQNDTTASAAASFLKALLSAARSEASANPQLAVEAAAAAEAVTPAAGKTASITPHPPLPSDTSPSSGGTPTNTTPDAIPCGPTTQHPLASSGFEAWVGLWRRALLDSLYSGNEKLRSYVSVHALPVVLGLEPSSALALMSAVLCDGGREPVPGTSRVAALVAVLKAARGMGLIGDLDCLLSGATRRRLALDPGGLLEAAVGHASEAVRLDALELACVAFKMSDPPGHLELSLVRRWLILCMRSTALGARNKCLVLVGKLVSRVRLAVGHIQHRLSGRGGGPAHPSSSKGRGLQVLFSQGAEDDDDDDGDDVTPNGADGGSGGRPASRPTDPRVTGTAVLARLQAFMQWLTRLLVSGLYPGSPYERRFFALELLAAVLEAWGPYGTGSGGGAVAGGGKGTSSSNCDPLGARGVDGGGSGGQQAESPSEAGADQGSTGSVGRQKGPMGRMAESTSLVLLPRRGVNMPSAAAVGGGRGGGKGDGRARGGGGGEEDGDKSTVGGGGVFRPYCDELLSPNTVALLLAGAVDSWDKLRQAASSCLMRLPTPLPGLTTGGKLTPLLGWAVGLLASPRARESDAGARLIKILYGKYVAQCGWRLQLHPTPKALPPTLNQHQPHQTNDPKVAHQRQQAKKHESKEAPSSYAAVLAFLDAVLDLVEAAAAAARADLLSACRRSLAHGPLLLLRYAVEEVPWAALGAAGGPGEAAAGGGGASGGAVAAAWASRALAAAEAVVEVALPILSRPQERNVGAEEVDAAMMPDDDEGDPDGGEGDEDGAEEAGEGGDGLGPEAQIIITACWTSVKEVSLVLATMVRHMPLPSAAALTESPVTSTTTASTTPPAAGGAASASAASPALLSCAQLRRIGELLVRLLFEMKHNGAVDKTAAALTAVAERLLRASAPELNALPRPWLEACLNRVLATDQSRDDIVRRSSGLPFALGALFLAEPGNAPKTLLARGMTALLATAAAATSPYVSYDDGNGGEGGEGGDGPVPTAVEEGGGVVVVEGRAVRQVWPVVHAFNCLRHAFNDSHLAVDTSGYFAHAIQACLRALRSPAWEIRNSAMLCFTALTSRVLGFKNEHHSESCRKAVSGTEFFARYPALHGFLLAQLQEAAAELQQAGSSGCRTAVTAAPHPGLYPVLIILSRLRASHIRDESASPVADGQEAASTVTATAADPSVLPVIEENSVARVTGSLAAATPPSAASTFMGALTPVAFTAPVRRCATAAPLAVRRLAARALAPLVASQDVPALLGQLLRCVPGQPTTTTTATTVTTTVNTTVSTTAIAVLSSSSSVLPVVRFIGSTCNELHGALLQAAALLETVSTTTTTKTVTTNKGSSTGGGDGSINSESPHPDGGPTQCDDDPNDVLRIALPHLVRGAWLTDPRVGCSALGCALLQAAAAALALMTPSRCQEFRTEVVALEAACRQTVTFTPSPPSSSSSAVSSRIGAVAGPSGEVTAAGGGGVHHNVFATDFPDPMRCELLKRATQMWLGPVLQCQAFRSSAPTGFLLEGLLHKLKIGIASPLYDTRAAVLKAFVRYLTELKTAAAATTIATSSQPPSGLRDPSSNATSSGEPASSPSSSSPTGLRGLILNDGDAGGKLAALVPELLARPALLRRLVTEGMSELWRAVATEPIHNVVRRALKALGLLHALSTSVLLTAPPPPIGSGGDLAFGDEGAAMLPSFPLSSSATAMTSSRRAVTGHPMSCLCCNDPSVSGDGAAAAAGDLGQALSHVALVQRLLSVSKELEARCEALKCLGRALGSALVAATVATTDNLAPSSASLSTLMAALVTTVASAVQPWQPEDWRLAGVEALAACGLLQAAAAPTATEAGAVQTAVEGGEVDAISSRLTQLALRGWRCVFTMLEDEDYGVRNGAAKLAQEVMELAPPPPSPSNGLTATVTSTPAGTAAAAGAASEASMTAIKAGGSSSVADREDLRPPLRQGTCSTSNTTTDNNSTLYDKQPMYVEVAIRRLYNWLVVRYGSCAKTQEARTNRDALLELLCELVTRATEQQGGGGSGCVGGGGEDVANGGGGDGLGGLGVSVPEVVASLVAAAARTGSGSEEASAAPPTSSRGPTPPQAAASNMRRLFEQEADNPHEEILLTAQLAARSLRAALARGVANTVGEEEEALQTAISNSAGIGSNGNKVISGSGTSTTALPASASLAAAAALTAEGAERLSMWAAAAVRRLATVATALKVEAAGLEARGGGEGDEDREDGEEEDAEGAAAPGEGWLGGVVNHPEVFACIFRALLALWALGPVRGVVVEAWGAGGGVRRQVARALWVLVGCGSVCESQVGPLLGAVVGEWGEVVGLEEERGGGGDAERVLFLL